MLLLVLCNSGAYSNADTDTQLSVRLFVSSRGTQGHGRHVTAIAVISTPSFSLNSLWLTQQSKRIMQCPRLRPPISCTLRGAFTHTQASRRRGVNTIALSSPRRARICISWAWTMHTSFLASTTLSSLRHTIFADGRNSLSANSRVAQIGPQRSTSGIGIRS